MTFSLFSIFFGQLSHLTILVSSRFFSRLLIGRKRCLTPPLGVLHTEELAPGVATDAHDAHVEVPLLVYRGAGSLIKVWCVLVCSCLGRRVGGGEGVGDPLSEE